MDSFIHADIFFFVTTILAVVLGILVAVALFFLIKIMRNVSVISDTIRRESDYLADDVNLLRAKMRENSFSLSGIVHFVRSLLSKSHKK